MLLMGKSTISMVMFNSKLLVITRGEYRINQILYRMQVAGWRSDLLEVVRQAPTVTKRNTGYSGEMFKSELLFFLLLQFQ